MLTTAACLAFATAPALAQTVRPGGVRPMVNPMQLGNFTGAQIVHVNPQMNMLTLRMGAGAAAREQQFRLAENARLFGTDRRLLADGLCFNGFQPGANVFFRPGTGNTINDLRLFNPSLAAMRGRIHRGTIASVNPMTNTIVINTSDGERPFRVDRRTRFLNNELLAAEEGLAFAGFTAGAPIWFAAGTGTAADTLEGVSLANPVPAAAESTAASQAPPSGAPVPKLEPGVGPRIPSKYVAGEVVAIDPDGRTLTVQTGAGDQAKEMTLKVPTDASFFGPEGEPIQEGLKYEGLKPGDTVYMRVGTGELANTLREISLRDPNQKGK
jgi:hypothetical protein